MLLRASAFLLRFPPSHEPRADYPRVRQCCPSRTTLMSGSFVHNNKVESATAGGCMRMNTSRTVPGGRPSFWEHSFIRRLRYNHNYDLKYNYSYNHNYNLSLDLYCH